MSKKKAFRMKDVMCSNIFLDNMVFTSDDVESDIVKTDQGIEVNKDDIDVVFDTWELCAGNCLGASPCYILATEDKHRTFERIYIIR